MAKFHLKEDGTPAECTASVKSCPRGSQDQHYDSPERARTAYEQSMSKVALTSSKTYPSEYVLQDPYENVYSTHYGDFATEQAKAQKLASEGKFATVVMFVEGQIDLDKHLGEGPHEEDYQRDFADLDEELYQEAVDEWAEPLESSFTNPADVPMASVTYKFATRAYESEQQFRGVLEQDAGELEFGGDAWVSLDYADDTARPGVIRTNVDVNGWTLGKTFYSELYLYSPSK